MKEILDRIKAPTPKFWKRIQSTALSLFLLCGALAGGSIAVNGTEVALNLPEYLDKILQHITTVAAVVYVVSKFAVEGTYSKGE